MLAAPMIAATLLAITATGPGIAVRIEDARDVRQDEVQRLSAVFAEMIRASDRTVEFWSDQANDVVLSLKLEGAPTKIRLVAELSSPQKKLILDIPREERGWKAALLPLALDFFPPPIGAAGAAKTSTIALAPSLLVESTEPAPPPWPWVALGVAVVAGGTGAVLGLASNRADDRLNGGELTPAEASELSDAANGRALAANVLLGAAIVSATASVVLFLTGD